MCIVNTLGCLIVWSLLKVMIWQYDIKDLNLNITLYGLLHFLCISCCKIFLAHYLLTISLPQLRKSFFFCFAFQAMEQPIVFNVNSAINGVTHINKIQRIKGNTMLCQHTCVLRYFSLYLSVKWDFLVRLFLSILFNRMGVMFQVKIMYNKL